MSDQVSEMSPERKALLDQIEAMEGYIASPSHQQYLAAIDAEIEEATTFILEAIPGSLGDLVAHFTSLGKIKGLRGLKEKTHDILVQMREDLTALS